MLVASKNKVESRCGIKCSTCNFQKEGRCAGCLHIEKPFWADVCPIKSCSEEKKVVCCGNCIEFPCVLLTSFAYDKENGDHGERIKTCKEWAKETND